jgi:hypothetical protein
MQSAYSTRQLCAISTPEGGAFGHHRLAARRTACKCGTCAAGWVGEPSRCRDGDEFTCAPAPLSPRCR